MAADAGADGEATPVDSGCRRGAPAAVLRQKAIHGLDRPRANGSVAARGASGGPQPQLDAARGRGGMTQRLSSEGLMCPLARASVLAVELLAEVGDVGPELLSVGQPEA